MLFTNSTYIGIDPTAGQRPFTYAALDHELDLLALGQGHIDEVLAFVAGQRSAVVAVSGPRRPNQGIMANPQVRDSLSPPPRPGHWDNFRLVEYQLRQCNIIIPQTRSDEKNCPMWMRMSFKLFHRLGGLNYRVFPHEEASRQCLEVYPHACYTALLGNIPFPKQTLEGRIQRQLILYEQKLDVPDPMRLFEEITRHRLLQSLLPLEDLFSPEELDSLVAAYTAWLATNHPEQTSLLGDPAEGQVVVPVEELKAHY